MASPLQLLADPLPVVALAILIFVVRVMLLAKRLRWAASHPTAADRKALREARKALDAHKESLDEAKGTLSGNLEGAWASLRHYRKPLHRARSDKTTALGKAMQQTALEDAKKLYRSNRPRKRRRARDDVPSP